MKYYAVKKGRHPGIYNTWEECQNEVNQFKNAQFKSFTSKEEAWNYLNENTQKTAKPSLSKDQYNAYNQLISGKNIFLTGGAGTGKSFVLKLFISEMEKQNKKVILLNTIIFYPFKHLITVFSIFSALPDTIYII